MNDSEFHEQLKQLKVDPESKNFAALLVERLGSKNHLTLHDPKEDGVLLLEYTRRIKRKRRNPSFISLDFFISHGKISFCALDDRNFLGFMHSSFSHAFAMEGELDLEQPLPSSVKTFFKKMMEFQP